MPTPLPLGRTLYLAVACCGALLAGCGGGTQEAEPPLATGWPWRTALEPAGGRTSAADATTDTCAATLLVPGGNASIAWLPDGSFWTGDVAIRLVWEDGTPVRFVHKEGLQPGVPIFRSESTRDSLRIELAVLAPWAGPAYDSLVTGRLAARLTTAAREPRSASLALEVAAGGGPHHALHPWAAFQDFFAYRARAGELRRNDELIFQFASPWNPTPEARSGTPPVESDRWVRFASVSETLRPGAEAWWRFTLPARPIRVGAPAPKAIRSWTASAAETRAAWEALLARGGQISVPDVAVQRVFDASRAVVLSSFEATPEGALRAIGNPMQYRDFYLRDGARQLRALLLLGAPDLAAAVLDHMYEYQWPQGAVLSQRGQLDGTGQALWALGQYAALAEDEERVKRLLPAAIAGAEWIARMRRYTRLRGGPAAGLLPFGDPKDNELLLGHLLGNDAWAVAGLRAVASLCEAAGRDPDARKWRDEADGYAARLRAVWDREARRQRRPLPPSVEVGARDWGNWSAVYPLGVLEPSDLRFAQLDAWIREALYRDGLPTYGSPDTLHHYLGFDVTQANLRRGRRDLVVRDLRAAVAHTQPDGTGFEVTRAEHGGFGRNLPPHGTFASMFVDLVRCALVYEEKESLVLLAGAPELWLEAGRSIVVDSLPTRWGLVSFRVDVNDRGELTWESDLPAAATVRWPMRVRAGSAGDRHVAERVTVVAAGRARERFLPDRD